MTAHVQYGSFSFLNTATDQGRFKNALVKHTFFNCRILPKNRLLYNREVLRTVYITSDNVMGVSWKDAFKTENEKHTFLMQQQRVFVNIRLTDQLNNLG